MNYARVLSTPLKKDNNEVVVSLTKYYALVRAGAKWGDTETFDMEEWQEILDQRERSNLNLQNSPYCYTFDVLIEEGVITRPIVEEEDPEPEEPEPESEPYRPPCEVCGIYLSHSSPPADFKGRNLCCLWCDIKKGASHGERCQRCPLTIPKPKPACIEYY
jgi:hypothetical protein